MMPAANLQHAEEQGLQRVPVTFYAEAAAGVLAAALMSLTLVRGGVAAGAALSHAIPAGKILRLQALAVSVRAGATTTAWTRFAVRYNPSGLVTATSPIVAVIEVSTPAALVGSCGFRQIPLPDGLEFSAGQIGITQIGQATSNLNTVCLVGFEYG